MTGRDRRDRRIAELPPGIVKIRLEGQSAPRLARKLTTLPDVEIVTGPDVYENGRIYLTVDIGCVPDE